MGTTLEEQLDRLDEARDAEANLGFRGRMPALCSLPRVDQDKRSHFIRQNGPINLVMSAGVPEKLSYGNLSRLLPARVCTEAVRTGQRNLVVGKSLGGFMDRLGSYSTSGSGWRRPREQMERLLSCALSLHYLGDDKSVRVARAVLHRRARAAHPPPHARPDTPGRKPDVCALRLMFPLPCFVSLKVTAGPRAFQSRSPAPSSVRAFGCLLALACRLSRLAGASQPPECFRSPNGASVIACPCRHCAALHSASLRPPAVGFGRCRRSRVSGKRSQTLYA